MACYIEKPIYFILGNHDYYRGTIADVRAEVTNLTKTNKYLCWLPAVGIKKLTDDVLLVGHDGWADGRLGDYQNSDVSLNDSLMIADLFQEKLLSKDKLLVKMQQLADVDARQLSNSLAKAIEKCPTKIIILVHVPPFKEACLHQGKISDENWLPYFSSKVLGDVILYAAQTNPNIEFLVLSGHTHSAAHYQPLENLTVNVGKAEYYRPQIQEVIII